MAKRGDGDLALTLANFASVCGGLVGALSLLLLAPPLAQVALAFGPVEYFWLAMLGLTLVAALSEGSLVKGRSEEHTSELQSLMRISYAVFCLKKKIRRQNKHEDEACEYK